jgi:hypothetical protein
MRILLCLFALLAIAVAQQQCLSCSNGCAAPYSGAVCQNNVWVYPGDLNFAGNVDISCPISVPGNANFNRGTTLNLLPCARLNIGGNFNAASNTATATDGGVNVVIDFNGDDPALYRDKIVFATFRGSSSGFINQLSLVNAGGSSTLPTLSPRLSNGEAAVLLNAVGDTSAGNGDLNKPVFEPGFDGNGKIRVCPTMTCANPTSCPSPRADAVCDPSGAWIIPGNVDAESISLACPLRVQGNLNVFGNIIVGGCGRLTVDGIARLTTTRTSSRISVDSYIPVTFDMNDYGKPTGASDTIPWFTAGQLLGGISQWTASNIWDDALTIANQRCGNAFTILFYRSDGVQPPDTCGAVTNAATIDQDDTDFAFADSDEFVAADFNDEFAAANADFEDFEGDAFHADDFSDNTEEFYDNAALGDYSDELIVDQAAADTQSTNTGTSSSSSAPAYAYALFVLGVLVLIALVIVQVQIVLIRRAREARRI